jgi:hypothetical protein
MSPLLEKILADVNRLEPSERLEVIARVAAGLQHPEHPLPKNKLSRKNLFGCLRGQVSMTADFNDPLSDFAEYM